MRIIKESTKKAPWPKKGTCSHCGCVVEAEEKDVQNMAERPGEPTIFGVKCPTPHCPAHIYFRP